MASQLEGAASQSRAARQRMWTRERLIEAARRVIARQGIDATTIADITSAADVGIGSFYNHFKSKEDLVGTLGGASDRGARRLARSPGRFGVGSRRGLRDLHPAHDTDGGSRSGVGLVHGARGSLRPRTRVGARRARDARPVARNRERPLHATRHAFGADRDRRRHGRRHAGTAARRAGRAGRPPDRRAPAADARGSGRRSPAHCESSARRSGGRGRAARARGEARDESGRRCEPRARPAGRDGLRPQQVHGLPELRGGVQDALDARARRRTAMVVHRQHTTGSRRAARLGDDGRGLPRRPPRARPRAHARGDRRRLELQPAGRLLRRPRPRGASRAARERTGARRGGPTGTRTRAPASTRTPISSTCRACAITARGRPASRPARTAR